MGPFFGDGFKPTCCHCEAPYFNTFPSLILAKLERGWFDLGTHTHTSLKEAPQKEIPAGFVFGSEQVFCFVLGLVLSGRGFSCATNFRLGSGMHFEQPRP